MVMFVFFIVLLWMISEFVVGRWLWKAFLAFFLAPAMGFCTGSGIWGISLFFFEQLYSFKAYFIMVLLSTIVWEFMLLWSDANTE